MDLDLETVGPFDVRYVAFLQTVTHLRESLHRYCSRMTGSALDGEDVMQEALFEAYRKLDTLDEPSAMRPWLFRIAHRRCLDFARRRTVRRSAEQAVEMSELVQSVEPVEPTRSAVGHAVERLVIHLPPKERACVLLKDVFEASLEEIADLVESTPGGVKAALSRARAKLATLEAAPVELRAAELRAGEPDPERLKLLALYVDHFNRRDWHAVRALTSADARLRVSNRFAGRLAESPYFSKYDTPWPWTMSLGELDGELVAIVQSSASQAWLAAWVVRFSVQDGRITRIHDHHDCPWLMPAADHIHITTSPPMNQTP